MDDSLEMREHLRLLSTWWDVEMAGDGPAALEAAERDKPDLVLCDVTTPRLDGLGLLTALRSDPNFQDVPVIQLSWDGDDETHAEGLRIGADDYLLKPISARELVARVSACFALARRRGEERVLLGRLLDLSTRLAAISDLPTLLEDVLVAVMEVQAADFGDIQVYDEATRTLRIVAHRGVGREFLDYFEEVAASDTSACGLALRAGERVIIRDVLTHPAYAPHRGIAEATGFRGVQSTPLLDHGTGKPIGMLSTLFREPYRPAPRDLWLTDFYARQAANIVAARLVEQRMRESESRLTAAVDLLQLGLYQWNPETDELRWDATVREMWGLLPDAAVDYEVWKAGVHPDDWKRVEHSIRAAVDPHGTGIYDEEYRVIGRRDRVERWIATRGQTHFENGRAQALYGVAVDITDRKRLERVLEHRVEARTRTLEDVNRQFRSRKRVILVVDDDPTVLRSTVAMVESLGFAAVAAQSGAEGLRAFASNPAIALVLADFAMPGMSGKELSAALRSGRPSLPVVLVTGHRDEDLLRDSGAARVLQKPYSEDDLLDKINAALG